MKLSKRLQALALVVVMLLSLCLMAGCNKENDTTPSGFKVTFMVEGKQYGEVQTVQKGRRITEPAVPTFSNSSYVFTGWYTDEACTVPFGNTTVKRGITYVYSKWT